MRLPSFFSRGGGGGRGGGTRVLGAVRRAPLVQSPQASSSSADHVRRKTERAKRREESGGWKDPEGSQAKIFAHASQADLQRRIALKAARYSTGVDLQPAKLPSDFAWRMCSDDEEENDMWALSTALFSWDGDY